MFRLSVIKNCDFLSFGIRAHVSEKIVWIEVETGRWVFLIWLKDRTFIESAPKLIKPFDTENWYV